MKKVDIKKVLKEKAKRKEKISISIDKEMLGDIKDLADKHKVTLSAFIEVILSVGLLDPYITNREDLPE